MDGRQPARGGKSMAIAAKPVIEKFIANQIQKNANPTGGQLIAKNLKFTGPALMTGQFSGAPLNKDEDTMNILQKSPFYKPNKSPYDIMKEHMSRANEFRDKHSVKMETNHGINITD